MESGGQDKIAMWMLDTDYDGRSLYPGRCSSMAGPKGGWTRLARNLKAEIDEDLIEAYRGCTSLPFEPGEHRRIAVKIVDDRGIESLKVMGLATALPAHRMLKGGLAPWKRFSMNISGTYLTRSGTSCRTISSIVWTTTRPVRMYEAGLR